MSTYRARLVWSIAGIRIVSVARASGGRTLASEHYPAAVREYLDVSGLDRASFAGLAANGSDMLRVTQPNDLTRIVTFRVPDPLRGPAYRERLAAARADGGPIVRTLAQLCRFFGADTPRGLNRRLYKDTACGASISLYFPDGTALHNGNPRWADLPATTPIVGFTIQTIVEGSDAEVNSDLFRLPVSGHAIDTWVADMEAQAADSWVAANRAEENEAP